MHYCVHITTPMEDAYLEALSRLNVNQVSRATGRGVRTLQAYRRGERRITEAAARELVDYLRAMSSDLTQVADALDALVPKEADDG